MPSVVVLAGGTGGAKLARGMRDIVGDGLTVVANTGDDIEIYGAYVSPDPDLITYWLADTIDPRGWGIKNDTFNVMEGLRSIGVEVWFELGDRDLAICIDRQQRLDGGATLSETLLELGRQLSIGAQVLPMAETPVRTWVKASNRWHSFQEYMIRAGTPTPVEDVEYRGAEQATVPPTVLDAIIQADAVILGPSNPVISIGPILAIPTLRSALQTTTAPVVAVSPVVAGKVVKGPTDAFMQWVECETSATGVAQFYGDLLDGIVADEEISALPHLTTDTLMSDDLSRRRVAEETLAFAGSLAGR